jgi:hypothetical protein
MRERKEKLIYRFKLGDIQSFEVLSKICYEGYKKTGNKFSIRFEGSKGYLSHIEISCEFNIDGSNNRIFNRSLDTMINIFYSDKNGVRLSMGDDKPRKITYDKKAKVLIAALLEEDDLPF